MAVQQVQSQAKIDKLLTSQMELREELNMKKDSYIAEVTGRLSYQNTLTEITDRIQAKCRDHRLVEEILYMAENVNVEGGDVAGIGM